MNTFLRKVLNSKRENDVKFALHSILKAQTGGSSTGDDKVKTLQTNLRSTKRRLAKQIVKNRALKVQLLSRQTRQRLKQVLTSPAEKLKRAQMRIEHITSDNRRLRHTLKT